MNAEDASSDLPAAQGEPLSMLAAAGPLPVGRVLALGIQLAAALAALHRGGRVHNGVRPEAVHCDPAADRAWLIDLGDMSHGAPASAASMNVARLVYASPEQTGRMDRVPDHRSDLYALGVVLYELLVGAPPFRSEDALELIHAHIARRPPAPIDIDAHVPLPVSQIVMKLLAKSPEERYQSAAALIDDLMLCQREWSARGRIDAFALGRRDIRERLPDLPRLYGREDEVAVLRAAFERAGDGRGRAPMLLVSGYPGIGKTALIHEFYKPLVRQQGYFVSGKFDQVARSVPFSALVQALRDLVRQMLTESESRLDEWRGKLLRALGANGSVLVEVIPEIEFIIGEQPTPVPLGAAETLNRFQRVFQNFVAAVAQPAHPLVVFLDDLQWADAATLSLLEPMLASADIRGLLLVGACRDYELDDPHRLTRALDGLAAADIAFQRVELGPLRLADLSSLVRDTLDWEPADAQPLARLVLEKTGGNPFFVVQFLRLLVRDGHIRFDEALGRWTCRIEAIARAPLADDVVDLMKHNIQRLSHRSQYALTLAACIGNSFDQRTLAIISEQPPLEVAEDLAEAEAEGLIVPAARRDGDAEPAHAFLHDRVQQAAYAMISDERKPMLHLRIGRLLLSRATPHQLEQGLFDIVHHLNRGSDLIGGADERLAVARLDLNAGRKAKQSTAHEAALDFFQAGIALLAEAHWSSDYALCFALHLEAAESLYLCARFEAAHQQFELLLRRAATDIDRARVHRLRSVQYEHTARYADALANTRAGLALFDVSLPEAAADKERALAREMDLIASLLGDRDIATLVDLPAMDDPKILIVMRMLTDIWASAYILGDPTLARLISATMVRLSLVHGNVEDSAYGYVTHAITVGPVRGDYRGADAFGKLALAVNHRFEDSRRRAKIYQQFHAHVNFWCQPWASCIPYAREACRSGLESGDFLYAAYGAGTELWSAILATQDLAEFVREYSPSVALIQRLKNQGFADSTKLILNWARALQGLTLGPLSLSDAAIDEDAYLCTYRDSPFFATVHAVAKLHVCCMLGTPAQALAAARVAGATVHHMAGTVWPLVYEFWSALALAAGLADAGEEARPAAVARIAQARASFDGLAMHCAENFHCPALLLAAELDRIEGREHEAITHYEQAIEYSAGRPGMLQQLALANELHARFRLARGDAALAGLFMAQARAGYARWGAAAKVGQLDCRYPELLSDAVKAPRELPAPTPTSAAPMPGSPEVDDLDLDSVLKAAQAIAGEVELDRLLARLMRIAIENAGAERGCLVLEREGEALVYAAEPQQAPAWTMAPGTPLAASRNLPASIVNYVRRTAQSVVLANAAMDDRFGSDPYMLRHMPRSVMCVAVQKQGRLVAVLYLENSVLAGAFTAERMRVVRVLATQAAIALENARLFEGLKREVHEHREARQQLGEALAQVGRLKEELEAENVYLRSELIANVSHDLRSPLVSLRGYLEMLVLKGDRLPPATRQSYLEIALRQSEYLATLIDELFELAKLDFKGLRLDREAFHLPELAVDVVQKFQLAADRKAVTLRIEPAHALPAVDADLGLVERVLDNLIGNALKHTSSGGSVSVRLRTEGERVIASVTDTGSGIPPSELPLVFDRFYRGGKACNPLPGGAGLGLAIARRIVELHGCQIAVESREGVGSCFSFDLPAAKSPAPQAAGAPAGDAPVGRRASA
ncbi:AAA family ATPase [Variovorax ginsengisoli]|uniref:histidine kinase n=1 Tax=Variovorax ginsengisoli TaxID=363844 RepID=A0ABT8S8M5_9BURK|nr:AAA family ATPase [Variovorax ginsengisoli]MDN8615197.1 AAA family ATPase [Variovorax ginsengisoli]MDO1534367.1 AAA family ATPase [Variovorax ginsengisoli]